MSNSSYLCLGSHPFLPYIIPFPLSLCLIYIQSFPFSWLLLISIYTCLDFSPLMPLALPCLSFSFITKLFETIHSACFHIFIFVRNCEGTDVLSYLQVNKLACLGFMDTGRRHKPPLSLTKDFIIHATGSSLSFMLMLVPFTSHRVTEWHR